MSKSLTHERLLEMLHYNPDTGQFVWKQRVSNIVAGTPCVNKDKKGYNRVGLDGKKYRASRLAWFYMTGAWPQEQIDHINGVQNDDRWCNLRDAKPHENCANRSKRRNGLKGASFHKNTGKWVSQIMARGKARHLGSFETESAAHNAYVQAAIELHREFARTK